MTEPKSARERFEAWWKSSGKDVWGYIAHKESFWAAWQAAERSGIERAAKAECPYCAAGEPYDDGYHGTIPCHVPAIRSLLTPHSGTEE